ncbi:urea ABC transporter permease [Bordetella sp. H567]|uniref:urea ABC transporter permease subunit UrtB n=1 Tax=Bordetella sp. H567 TaxID=1697043 RepID=UPI00081CD7E8|nr:urea ABC transporter permease subunit UrtB [Bordetella sp. H567]AOB30267.1 urea ABC transporter permease [Bordetella sp. H567]
MRIALIASIPRRLLAAWLLAMPMAAALGAGLDASLLAPLAGDDTDARLEAIGKLGQSTDPAAAEVLAAMGSDRLYATPDGHVLVDAGKAAVDPSTGLSLPMPPDAGAVMINNRLRRAIDGALAESRLHAADPAQRLAAAQRLQQATQPSVLPLIVAALDKEKDPGVRGALEIAQANLELKSPAANVRRHAVDILGRSLNTGFIPVLTTMTSRDAQGNYAEPDAGVRDAAAAALRAIDRHLAAIEWAGNLFYGISLGSVLLLAALGLAITFGLMGVINMAHGELLMIGAYATFIVQAAFRAWAPAWMDWYVIAALPVAFVLTALVGMALERTVIRWLYGRPLETLLATWGISLILMQLVRSLFGAQNVEVSNPGWMSGGVTIMGGLVLTYNRLVIIVFSLLVLFFVWVLLNHTRLGLFVRAITQNRRMADCVGVPTGRIDMLAFGLGSGIAGLAGVALSQLGNVGPDLGRGYIVDSFMVVVLGGVGQLAGTVIAALGLGGLNKVMEPYAGAVLAKIAILVLIVLFVQKRPQGLFAPRGRSVE